MLLDAYGYDGDRGALGSIVALRAQLNADVIRRAAAGDDPTYRALLPVEETMERSARYVADLPDSFWG
ncbi:MAG TPA: hypothetical protein VNP03_15010 [Pseudonocardia sp.]|nr:hypothetical protein [Pseudonocardia sp.]